MRARRSIPWVSVMTLAIVAGCGSDRTFGPDQDAGSDVTTVDTGSPPADTAANETSEDATADSGEPADSSAEDSTAAETTADTTVADSATDTFVIDTFVPDTFKPDTFVPDTSVVDTGPVSPYCGAGAIAVQSFGATMVGCAGKVPFASRASLCGGGYRVCSASWYVSIRNGVAPKYHYWTNESLGWGGSGSGACAAGPALTGGCSAGPMRVCAGTTDPLGNSCTWENCGYNTNTPNEYFGGCNTGDGNAGALCCAPPCADGSVEQEFTRGMFGCAGKVTFSNRKTLCGPGYRVCTASDWMAKRNGASPTHHYWTNDALKYGGSGSGACSVSLTTGTDCGAETPMRVCTGTAPTSNDPLGNTCNWTGCGWETTSPSQWFGGCAGNTTAGTLCCAY